MLTQAKPSVLNNPAIQRATSKIQYHVRRLQYQPPSSRLHPRDRLRLDVLHSEGVWSDAIHRLQVPKTETMLSAARSLLPNIAGVEALQDHGERSAASHSTCADPIRLMAQTPEVFCWGLQEPLLTFAACYLRQPVAYLGVMLHRSVANGRQVGTRLWHLDGEDYRTLKLMVYLNGVDAADGPFEYIPRRYSPSYQDFRGIQARIRDEEMAAVVPRSRWRACVGPTDTAIWVDTTAVFHHGRVPERDRYTLTFAYTSAQPKDCDRCRQFFPHPELIKPLGAQLTPQQWQSAMGWR